MMQPTKIDNRSVLQLNQQRNLLITPDRHGDRARASHSLDQHRGQQQLTFIQFGRRSAIADLKEYPWIFRHYDRLAASQIKISNALNWSSVTSPLPQGAGRPARSQKS